MENVPEVVGTKNIKDFQKWEQKLASLGYANHVQILNGKDYGIPQNRKRTFMVSILDNQSYEFPFKVRLTHTLKDMLEPEENVGEKYYLTRKMIDYLTGVNQKKSKYDRNKVFERNLNPNKTVAATITTRNGQRACDNYLITPNKAITETLEKNDINDIEDVAYLDGYNRKLKKDGTIGTITTRVSASNNDYLVVKNATAKGYLEAEEGDGVDISTRMDSHRGTVQKGSSQTITCKGGENVGVVVKETLKEQLCEGLVESGILQEGDIIKHSYTKQIMEGKKKAIEKQGEMITLTTRGDCFGIVTKGNYGNGHHAKNVYGVEGVSPTITTGNHGLGTAVEAEAKDVLRIRKLTPLTCFKLMGFEQKDLDSCREFSDAALYHVAGDSIITTVLVAIIGSMTDIDYVRKIENYVESLVTKEN